MSTKSVPVLQICKITGRQVGQFPSIREASRTMGVHIKSLQQAINRPTRSCAGYIWRTESPLDQIIATPKNPTKRVLFLDIETAPYEAYIWRMWKQDIFPVQIISDWYIMTWSAKWLDHDEVFSDRLTGKEAIQENDERLMTTLWPYLDAADVVITHNGSRFDMPKIKTKFLQHSLAPPSFYKELDTLKVARAEFSFAHNTLDYIASFFGMEGKMKTELDLWIEAKHGNNEALAYMEEYNKRDVEVLENVYLRFRPWIKSHPNMDLYLDTAEPNCPRCGSSDIEIIPGKYVYTQAVKYPMYRCNSCKGISRGKKGLKYNHKKQISSIPR